MCCGTSARLTAVYCWWTLDNTLFSGRWGALIMPLLTASLALQFAIHYMLQLRETIVRIGRFL